MDFLDAAARRLDVWNKVVEPTLGATVSVARLIGGMAKWFPFRSSIRRVAIEGSELMNKRSILDVVENGFASASIFSVDASDRRQDHDALQLFFRIGLRVGDEPHYGNRLGSGLEDDPENCFFPTDLAAGPTAADPAMASERNVRIAESCAFLSILSYRDDDDILRCMTNPDPLMLPGVSFLSVHTHEEGDLNVFMAEDQTWAVFCFRGTECETLRDWLTSVLLNPTTFFSCGTTVDAAPHMREMKVRDRYFKQMLLACRGSKVENVTFSASPIPQDASVSAFDLVNHLHHHGAKIYYTGHSLGGGLATLFGASMQAWDRDPAAIITFGSPPVGDIDFCQWFDEFVPVSWRFVNGDEFAPMAPPLPFTEPVTTQELLHVGGLIKVENLMDSDPHAMSPIEMDRRLSWLQQHNMLSKIILDHNAALTLLALRDMGNSLRAG